MSGLDIDIAVLSGIQWETLCSCHMHHFVFWKKIFFLDRFVDKKLQA